MPHFVKHTFQPRGLHLCLVVAPEVTEERRLIGVKDYFDLDKLTFINKSKIDGDSRRLSLSIKKFIFTIQCFMQPFLLTTLGCFFFKKNKLTIHQRILEYNMLIKFTDQNKDDKLDFPQKSWKIHVQTSSALGTRSEKNGSMWETFPTEGGGHLFPMQLFSLGPKIVIFW